MTEITPGAILGTDTLRQQIDALGPWFHNLDLGGVFTAPTHFLGNYPSVKWARFAHALPADLRGKTVLDVGCNAGFYSFEMKRRGADRVVAVDADPRYLAQARFAAAHLKLDVEFHQLSVYEIGQLGERFDLVMFLGVLYHLRHPLLALDLLRTQAVGDLLVTQSMLRGSSAPFTPTDDAPFDETTMFDDPAFPQLAFIEHRYAGDPTNWWVPNRACLEGMLRSAGFRILDHPEDEVYVCAPTAIPHDAGLPAAFGGCA